jgi:sec-independent protein translocase protein TatB
MFDVGFWELTLIALVALLVIGPERLPKVARTAGLWIGRGRRLISSVKADIEREIKADELKEILSKQAKSAPLEEIVEDSKGALDQFRREVEKGQGSAPARQGEGSKTGSGDRRDDRQPGD